MGQRSLALPAVIGAALPSAWPWRPPAGGPDAHVRLPLRTRGPLGDRGGRQRPAGHQPEAAGVAGPRGGPAPGHRPLHRRPRCSRPHPVPRGRLGKHERRAQDHVRAHGRDTGPGRARARGPGGPRGLRQRVLGHRGLDEGPAQGRRPASPTSSPSGRPPFTMPWTTPPGTWRATARGAGRWW